MQVNRTVIRALLAIAALAVGCARPAPRAAAPEAAPLQTDYAAPPELTGAVRDSTGAITLSGTGKADAKVRLASPDRSAQTTAVSPEGVWTLSAPAAGDVRLYSLSQDVSGRTLRARGYVATGPSPAAPAVVLRPGTAAEPLSGRDGVLRLSAMDFDRSGASVAAGTARPGDPVRVQLDGVDAGAGQTNARGVFRAPLTQTVYPGAHTLTVISPRGQTSAAFTAAPAGPLPKPPFKAARSNGAWRIDWMTPGGGVQTTIIFDPAEAAS